MKNKLFYILFSSILFTTIVPGFSKSREWEVVGEMPFPVYNGESIVLNSHIYIMGGYNPVTQLPTDTIQIYSPMTFLWEPGNKMNTKRAGFIADLYNNSVIIIGGTSGDSSKTAAIEQWDAIAPPFITTLNDTTNRINATGGVYNDFFYIFGGYTGVALEDSTTPYILEYNIPNHRIYNTLDTEEYKDQLIYQELSGLLDDNFYLFGGVYFGVTKKINVFNITNKTYSRIYPDLFEARAGGKAITTSNKEIVIIGGFNETQTAMASTEIFKIKGQSYILSQGPLLNYARKEFMVEEYDGYLYVFGGLDGNNEIVPYIERMSVFESNTDINPSHEKNAYSANENYYLLSNYPNPFNAGTTISFQVDNNCITSLDIFSIDGRKIKTLFHNIVSPGNHHIHWDGTDDKDFPVPSNIYFCKLTAGNKTEYKKMLLLK